MHVEGKADDQGATPAGRGIDKSGDVVTIQPVAATVPPSTECDWLVLVYMDVGGPELIEPAKAELFEMVAANLDLPANAKPGQLQVIVQTTGLLLDGRNTRGTRRYRIADGKLIDLSARVEGRQYGQHETDSPLPHDPFRGSYDYPLSTSQSLKSLICDAWKQKEIRPKRRMLILWGHGAGVGLGLDLTTMASHARRPGRPLPGPDAMAASRYVLRQMSPRLLDSAVHGLLSPAAQRPGDGPQPTISQTTSTVIEDALRKANVDLEKERFDLIIFDSCFLSSAEMAFQVRKLTRYFIASQGTIGFPTLDLTRLLRSLLGRANGDDDLLELGKSIVDQALDADSGAAGLSLFRCDVDGWGDPPWDFLQRLRALVSALRLAIWIPELRADIREAFEAAAWLEVRQFVDVVDLAVRLQRCRAPDTARAEKKYALDSDLHVQLSAFEDKVLPKLHHDLVVAAEELENLFASPNGFLAYHRSRRVADAQEQGISIYLPWFRCEAGGANVKVDPGVYSSLDLNHYSRWSDFIYTVSPEDTRADVDAQEELHRLRAAIADLHDEAYGALDTKRDRLDTKRDRLDTKRAKLDTKRDKLAKDGNS